MQMCICDTLIDIEEMDGLCYISPWSEFIIRAMPRRLQNMTVCDYGSGTGIISIVSILKGASFVVAIERDATFRTLTEKNYNHNFSNNKLKIYKSSAQLSEAEYIDYIFCNPACYPSSVGMDSFFHAGEMGIDMICEVFSFASKALKKTGYLLILIPSILPTSLIFEELSIRNLSAKMTESIYVPLRMNLACAITQWVDNKKRIYPEMNYFEIGGTLSEKVNLYEISRSPCMETF